MKILLIHNLYQQLGGEDRVFKAEADMLRRRGHVIIEHLVSNSLASEMNFARLGLNAIWSRQAYKKISDLIRKHEPDIVHFHNTFLILSPSVYYACKKSGVPVVQTLHNYRLICPNALLFRNNIICEKCMNKFLPYPAILYGCWRNSRLQTLVPVLMMFVHRILKTWRKQVDIYLTLTGFTKKKFIESGVVPKEKLIVKPNFIYPDPGQKIGGGEYFLFLGRLSEEKGVSTLVKAWENLKGIPLKIVGDGPLFEELKSSPNNQIEFVGQKDRGEVFELLENARCLVFPSECYEPFGNTQIEAFACGIPVIASKLGSIVSDMKTGLHFQPGDSKDLARKVEWAWDNTEEMKKMGKNARKEYEEKYTEEQNYKILEGIYKDLLFN